MMDIFLRIRSLWAEKRAVYTLYCLSLVLHLLIFSALLFSYGPHSFFLSTDGRVTDNDTQHYVTIAKNLAEGHGYSRFAQPPFEPDALRTPLLPLYFLPFVAIGGLPLIWLAILLLNFVLSLAPVFLYKLSRFFVSHRMAMIAGMLLAVEPLFLYRSQIAEPDALLVVFLMCTCFFLVRSWKGSSARDLYVVATLCGISILAKPSALYITALVFIFHLLFIIFFRRGSWMKEARSAVLAAVIVAAILSPWLLRNHALFGTWTVSTVAGYNLYQYYTADLPLPDERVPEEIRAASREPSRHPAFQSYFTDVALARIEARPYAYAREHVMGSLRNLFVSDLPAIYYYGHSAILPFSYDPESKMNIHELLLRGDLPGAARASLLAFPKIIWALVLVSLYMLAFWGWIIAWKRDRLSFLAFTLFFALYAYLIVASGLFVDAKYRLPALPLITLVALYGASSVLRGVTHAPSAHSRQDATL